jgi:hypothetical protein
MSYTAWAENTARSLLRDPLPRRWAHVRQVAATARTLAPVAGDHADLLTAAAWLHDVGYAPAISDTGFHPLDGARHLRHAERADDLLCRLVAYHSCAVIEAAHRGLAATLAREFRPPPPALADALTYCDMTTGPDGQPMPVHQRLAEARTRYGPGHVVSRSLARSGPHLTASVTRVTAKLDDARTARRTACRSPLAAAA